MSKNNVYKDLLLGVAVGDALGVPVEFTNRETLQKNPVTDMMGYGTHHLPAGTWSDDSSLSFCLAEALTHKECNLESIAKNFVLWVNDNYWTATGKVFDIGEATAKAIKKISKGTKPDLAGGDDELSNGNGSLMRIAPLIFYLMDKPIHKRFEITRQVSSITHRHIRSVIACFYYLEFARQLIEQKNKSKTYKDLQEKITAFLQSIFIEQKEINFYNRLLRENIYELPEPEIQSDGYVVHTLEAAIWCLLTTDNYKDAVLKAVNLGEDTDTTAAVTGGLAGLLYGSEKIPYSWIKLLAKRNEIEELAGRMKVGR